MISTRAIPAFQERPEIQLILLSVNDRAEIGHEGVDILIRPRSTRLSGVEHRQQPGLVVRRPDVAWRSEQGHQSLACRRLDNPIGLSARRKRM